MVVQDYCASRRSEEVGGFGCYGFCGRFAGIIPELILKKTRGEVGGAGSGKAGRLAALSLILVVLTCRSLKATVW